MTRKCVEKIVRKALKDMFQGKIKGKKITDKTCFSCELDFEAGDMKELLCVLDKKFSICIRKCDDVSTFGTLIHSIMIGVIHRRIKK